MIKARKKGWGIWVLLLGSAQGNICKPLINEMERAIGAPHNLMYSVAVIESGQYNRQTRQVEPTPWTLNTGGKAFYFSTKYEAVAKVRELQDRGVRNIDVGCMQVNLHHHGHHFNSIEDAFDPYTNVRYAATFLKNLMDESRSWPTAVANYHSRNTDINQEYQRKVYARWDTEKHRDPLSYGHGNAYTIPASRFQNKLSYVPVPVRLYQGSRGVSPYRASPALYTTRAGLPSRATTTYRPVAISRPHRTVTPMTHRSPAPLRPVGVSTYRPALTYRPVGPKGPVKKMPAR